MTSPADEPRDDGLVKPFLAHLDDLRRMLLVCIAALALGIVVAIPLAPRILDLLRAPLHGIVENPDQYLRSFDPVGALSVAMQLVFWSGLLLASPVILGAVAWFIVPALRPGEKRVLGGMLAFAAALFAGGVLLGYFYALPAGLRAMLWVNEWLGLRVEFFQVTSYIGFVLKLLLAFGLTFELPAILLALGQVGLVHSRQLRHYRRHAFVLILVVAMVITPTTDPFSQILLALPLALLYELTIWLIWARERRQALAAP
jgi:sec-independent protein translocase protein TatC